MIFPIFNVKLAMKIYHYQKSEYGEPSYMVPNWLREREGRNNKT